MGEAQRNMHAIARNLVDKGLLDPRSVANFANFANFEIAILYFSLFLLKRDINRHHVSAVLLQHTLPIFTLQVQESHILARA